MSGSLISLFPIGVYHATLTLENDSVEFIKNLEYLRVKNNNGYISKDHYILNDPELDACRLSIIDHLKIYAFDILKISKNHALEITTSWANKHNALDYSQEHNHNNSIFSGILYIDVMPESGELIFTNPFSNFGSSIEPQIESYSQFNSNEAKMLPGNGDLLLFPSGLKHRVGINCSNKARYSLAFNVITRGKHGLFEKELII